MQFYDKQNIVNVLEDFEYGKAEFIAFIFSSWHLDMFYSWIIQNRLSNGAIFVLPQSDVKNKSRYRLNADNFVLDMGYNTHVYFISELKVHLNFRGIVRLNFFNQRGKPFHIFNPGGINYQVLSNLKIKRREIHYVQLDEGTSTYFPEGKKGLLLHDFKKPSFQKQIKGTLGRYLKKILAGAYSVCSPVHFTRYFLFRKKRNALIANAEPAVNLSNYYQRLYSGIQSFNNNSILLLKDFDEEIVPFRNIIDMYSKLLEQLKVTGLKVYLKKHPNDQINKFDELLKKYKFVEQLNSGFSAEAIIPSMKPLLVIGGISTSLFTIPCIYQIRTICFMNKYLKYPELNPLYKERIKMMNTLFSNVSPHLELIREWDQIGLNDD